MSDLIQKPSSMEIREHLWPKIREMAAERGITVRELVNELREGIERQTGKPIAMPEIPEADQ